MYDKTDIIISIITDVKVRGAGTKMVGYEPNLDTGIYCIDAIDNEYEYDAANNKCIIYVRVAKENYNKFKKKIDGKKVMLKKRSLISSKLQAKSERKERAMRDKKNIDTEAILNVMGE